MGVIWNVSLTHGCGYFFPLGPLREYPHCRLCDRKFKHRAARARLREDNTAAVFGYLLRQR
jgi:hypothetical protein